jgi:trimeric autotransporter adhesin
VTSGVKTSATSVAPGGKIFVSSGVKNSGTAAAGAFKIEFWLSTNNVISTGDKLLTTLSRSGLGSGVTTSTSATLAIPAGTAPGTYYIGQWIDRTNQVAESTTANNITTLKITVAAAGTKADLSVTSFKPASTTYGAGASIFLSTSLKNLGGTAAGPFKVEYRLSPNDTLSTLDTLLGTVNKASLSAGGTTTANILLKIPAGTKPGTYWVGVWVDRENKVSETTTSNNKAVVKIVVSGSSGNKADLIGISLVNAPTTIKAGTKITSKLKVKNQGKTAAAKFSVEFRLSNNTTISTSDKVLYTAWSLGLAPGATQDIERTFTVPAGTAIGTWYIGAMIDGTKAIDENLETNNTAFGKFTVGAVSGAADLYATSVSRNLSSYKPGGTVIATAYVKNGGAGKTGTFNVEFRLTDNTAVTTLDKLLYTAWVAPMTGNSATTVKRTIKLPADTKLGATWRIGVIIDGSKAIAESSETNNTKYSPMFTVAN